MTRGDLIFVKSMNIKFPFVVPTTARSKFGWALKHDTYLKFIKVNSKCYW